MTSNIPTHGSTSIDSLERPPPLSLLETTNQAISMVDSVTKQQIVKTHCFWCRHPYDGEPIGCPIRFVPFRETRSYTTQTTNETYTVTQELTRAQAAHSPEARGGYYETDGDFCSFNCCLAFARAHRNDNTYRDAEKLIHRMRAEALGVPDQRITPAPSWRMLEQYGGRLTIEQFRESFDRFTYDDADKRICKPTPCVPTGKLFNKHFLF